MTEDSDKAKDESAIKRMMEAPPERFNAFKQLWTLSGIRKPLFGGFVTILICEVFSFVATQHYVVGPTLLPGLYFLLKLSKLHHFRRFYQQDVIRLCCLKELPALTSELKKPNFKMVHDSEKGRYASPEGSPIWEYISTMSCAFLLFAVFCVIGWNSPSLALLMKPDSPIPITHSDASTLTAMVTLGHALAPTFTMLMADKLGRKNSLLAAGIPTIISWVLILVAKNVAVLLVARLIGGLSIGFMFCVPQMYLGEIASPKLRGAIGMVCGTMMNAAQLVMFVAVPYVPMNTITCSCLSIAIASVISVWFIPESPYFLAMVGKMDEAEGALEKLRGKTDVTEELELIKTTISQGGRAAKNGAEGEQEDSEKMSNLKKLFTIAGNRKALYINFLFNATLQLGSYISTMAYGHIIFEEMKTGIPADVCVMINGALQLVCNILAALVIDKVGRKPLIGISGVTSGFCLLVVAVYFYLLEHTEVDVSSYGVLAACAVFSNVVAINIGLMPLQHVVQSEILATDIKGLATCIIGVGGGVLATLGVKAYLTIAMTWGFGHAVPFFIFIGNTWFGTALIMKILPETKGKTLWEIQKDLNA